MEQELPLSRHVVSAFQHIDLIEYLMVIMLMGAQEVIVGNPECHVIVGDLLVGDFDSIEVVESLWSYAGKAGG